MNKMAKRKSTYAQIIETIFFRYYKQGSKDFSFHRDEIIQVAAELGLKRPKNIGDVPYTFRYRKPLPQRILETAPEKKEWIIRGGGISLYKFVLVKELKIAPNENLSETKIPDATPGIISKYAIDDEQAVLAKIRYNRLIDIFTGLTCYSLQSHLRTTVKDVGQVESDEVYLGIDKKGVHYIILVQAKGGKERLGRVQIEQDLLIGKAKFPGLICKAIGAQFMKHGSIALFEFEPVGVDIRIETERHYRLVSPDELTPEELEIYKTRLN